MQLESIDVEVLKSIRKIDFSRSLHLSTLEDCFVIRCRNVVIMIKTLNCIYYISGSLASIPQFIRYFVLSFSITFLHISSQLLYFFLRLFIDFWPLFLHIYMSGLNRKNLIFTIIFYYIIYSTIFQRPPLSSLPPYSFTYFREQGEKSLVEVFQKEKSSHR